MLNYIKFSFITMKVFSYFGNLISLIRLDSNMLTSVYRLKAVEIVLNGLDELKQNISENERMLAYHDTITADMDTLQATRNQLRQLERSVASVHGSVNQINNDMMGVKQQVTRHRPVPLRSPTDVQFLENDVSNTTARYDNLAQQVKERSVFVFVIYEWAKL